MGGQSAKSPAPHALRASRPSPIKRAGQEQRGHGFFPFPRSGVGRRGRGMGGPRVRGWGVSPPKPPAPHALRASRPSPIKRAGQEQRGHGFFPFPRSGGWGRG